MDKITLSSRKICERFVYSLPPTLFVLFEKLNFLREHHLLFCLPFKNV